MPLTLTFEDPAATRIETSGGKGANLSILTQKGFQVPPGFVATGKVYLEFMSQAEDLLNHLDGVAIDDPDALATSSGEIQKAMSELELSAQAREEIREQLGSFPEGSAFSVRSSSTMEDLAGAAFAGQHETYLNVIGVDNVFARVRDCFVSLWAGRAIAYRQQQGFDHTEAVMAVVVQLMVPSESAGVGFSINPINGRLGEMVINSNFGLGESVVSGEGEIDQWIIEKETLSVSQATIGRKSHKVVSDSAGTSEVELAEGEAAAASLSDDQISQLAKLLVEVEDAYGFPQDIEWAFAEGMLWLLQSRPVTTIPPHWTRDESAERFPNVLTPLTWDFVESGFHRSLEHSFAKLGFPRFSGKWFGKFDHYIYGNQNAVELYAKRAPFAAHSLDDLRKIIPALRQRYAWVQDLPIAWMRDLDHYLVSLGRYEAEPLDSKTPLEIWHHVLEINEHGACYFLPNIAISVAHGVIHRILHGILKMVMTPDEAALMFDQLMAWCDTKTGQINKELYEIAHMANSLTPLKELIMTRESREIIESGMLNQFGVFKERLELFLRNHGHREVDFDSYVPTWAESPWIVLDNLRLILQTPMEESPAEKQRELKICSQRAELELFAKVPEDLHFFFHELLRLARVYTSLDDLEHYQTTRLTPALRRGLRKLGEGFVSQGVMEEPMDVFFAHQEQLEEALTSGTIESLTKLAGQVRKQKKAYLVDRDRSPDWVLGSSDEVVESPIPDGDMLVGMAGSPGVAEGSVYIVLKPEDFAKFPKDAILVARTTNPTWTPLFYSAKAVITESGGPLSHGAVTAREMGIPAVMSVRESLTRLKNGQRVRVDGSSGRVEVLTAPIHSPSGPKAESKHSRQNQSTGS